jgi:serine/threonine protein kinase
MADEERPSEAAATLQPKAEEASSAVPNQLVNTVFEGKYRIEELLGQGGMGVVYRATHVFMDRPVAIKFLHADRLNNASAIERFKQEARAAGRIQHPNATAVLDFGIANGIFYLVMEYLEGRTLRARLRSDKSISDREVVRIMSQVCEAVDAAHKCNIIHRDLKPDNIFLQLKDEIETVKVLDFGVAKIINNDASSMELTVDSFMGTPYYMSPEQFQNDPLSPATDVYSLGIIIFELLTGQRPFNGETVFTVGLKHMSEPVPSLQQFRSDLPAAVDEVVKRALSKNPQKRYQSALELAQDLRKAMKSLQRFSSSVAMPQLSCADSSCIAPQPGEHGRCLTCGALFAGTLVRHRYEIQRALGRNNFGRSYLIKDLDCFNEPRILKELALDADPGPNNNETTAERLFKREAIVLLTLQHPGIPKLYAFFIENNHSYLVQDYISGQNLIDEIRNRKRLMDETEAITVLNALADIMEYMHTRTPPIIHRDIRPHNMLRHASGQIQIIDFGAICLAASTLNASNTVIGSPGYAAPEQLYGKSEPQSDLYSAAASILYLMSGVPPKKMFNIKTAHLEWEKHIQLSEPLAAIIRDMVLPFIERRMASATELKQRLAALNPVIQSAASSATETVADSHISSQPASEIKITAEPVPKVESKPIAAAKPSPPDHDFQGVAELCYEIESFIRTMDYMNHYALLGVERNASSSEIQCAYEKLARKFHPDRQEELTKFNIVLRSDLEKIFARISQAYHILCDDRRRDEYDRSWRATGKFKLPSN